MPKYMAADAASVSWVYAGHEIIALAARTRQRGSNAVDAGLDIGPAGALHS